MNVYLLSLNADTPKRGYWDYAMLEDFLVGKLWKPSNFPEFQIYEADKLPKGDKAIVVLPARHHKGLEEEVNKQLKKIKKVVLFLCGDEEAEFKADLIKHDDIQIWVMNPHMDCKFNKLGTGYSPHASNYPLKMVKKDLDLFFSGQITHKRRSEMWRALSGIENFNILANKTKGFTQGLETTDYTDKLARSKVSPAPSGAEIPDSFRLWESLELMSFVIADQKNSQGTISNYWDWFFDETPPFYLINDWNDLPSYLDKALGGWQENIIRQTCFWYKYKRDLTYKVMDFLGEQPSGITVIIPSSPINSHPSTKILDETIDSIRHHLPDAEIIVTFDGVRAEQEDKKEKYLDHIIEFMKRLKAKNILPVYFEEHQHQSGMLKHVLKYIKTDKVMYVEHDTPLVVDRDIDFNKIEKLIDSGDAYTVRLHHEAVIPKEHKPLILDRQDDFIKTVQWSQRPHITTKAYLQTIADYFQTNSRSFIEDIWHSIVQRDFNQYGMKGWFKHRLWIYAPDDNTKFSYHTDGRGDEKKYKQGWEK